LFRAVALESDDTLAEYGRSPDSEQQVRARVSVLFLEKTGTVTSARHQVVAAETFGKCSSDEIIRLDGRCETRDGRDPCTTACTEETNAHR
jgi:hypothetical protein